MGIKYGEKFLAEFFDWLTPLTTRHPIKFILFPCLFTLFFYPSFYFIKIDDDPEFLYSPTNGRTNKEKSFVEQYYTLNFSSQFEQGHLIDLGHFVRILLLPKDDGDVFREEFYQQALEVDRMITSVSIQRNDTDWTYYELCAKNRNGCYREEVLNLADKLQGIKDGSFCLKYPIVINNKTWEYKFYGMSIGKPYVSSNSCVTEAKAIAISYHLDSTDPSLEPPVVDWINEILKVLAAYNNPYLSVERFTSLSIGKEIEAGTLEAIYFFSITIISVGFFTITTCLMSDCVRSKPLCGVFAFFSTCQAVVVAFGILLYMGFDFISINMTIPFIMAGIGVDDGFVLLAAWRRTDPDKSLEERMSASYKHAGVSITITSLTNLTSFMVGCITPVMAVRIFCIYASLALVITYIFQITFFSGCMAILGRAESKNLHAVTFKPAVPKSLSHHRGLLFRLLCTGGRNPNNPNDPIDNAEHTGMVFFRDYLGKFLTYPIVKLCVLIIFAVYLAGAIYGCMHVKEGLEVYDLFSYKSYATRATYYESKYLYQYMFRINIIVQEPIDYSDPIIHWQLKGMMNEITSLPYVANNELTESWLDYFHVFLNTPRARWMTIKYDVSKKLDFINCIKYAYFKFPPSQRFKSDLIFNENNTEIISSRFFVQSEGLKSIGDIKDTMVDIRKITDKMPFKIIVYNPYFSLFDLYTMIFDVSLKAILISSLIVMVIALFFIPSYVSCFWIGFSIASIETGIVGYLTLWGIDLNAVSMIGFIMCIGFSVDNAAHISYAYVSTEKGDPNMRLRNALYYVGVPILQSAGSTVAGVIVFAWFAPSYSFTVFFKTICLVMLFSSLHSILLIPVVLSLFDRSRPSDNEEVKDKNMINGLDAEKNLPISELKLLIRPPEQNHNVIF